LSVKTRLGQWKEQVWADRRQYAYGNFMNISNR
jgi:hypothetical protein